MDRTLVQMMSLKLGIGVRSQVLFYIGHKEFFLVQVKGLGQKLVIKVYFWVRNYFSKSIFYSQEKIKISRIIFFIHHPNI